MAEAAAEAMESLPVSNPEIPESSDTSISNPTHELSLEQRFQIVRSVGEECIQEDELRNLLEKKPEPVCYDGFEPSGRMHIAQGVMKTINVNKLTSAGCRVKIWIADWFAKLNNKMGGDLKKIETVGRYLIEIWKAVGMDLEGGKVEFLWSSKEINARADEYWPLVLDIAQKNNLKRIIRCSQIMGRSEQDELTAAQIFYPCMQCADIFFLKLQLQTRNGIQMLFLPLFQFTTLQEEWIWPPPQTSSHRVEMVTGFVVHPQNSCSKTHTSLRQFVTQRQPKTEHRHTQNGGLGLLKIWSKHLCG